MTTNTCQQLDAYLIGDLDPASREEFKLHLADCESCRFEVAEQSRIDELFKTAAESIPCPPMLASRIRQERDRRSDRRRSQIASLIAASLVIGILGWSLVFRQTPVSEPVQTKLSPEPTPEEPKRETGDRDGNSRRIAETKPPEPVQIEFPDDVLSLPIETGDPDITLIQVFPVSKVANDSR